jgi:CO dehydrogenase/acetyl-CoA synthase beta subunit
VSKDALQQGFSFGTLGTALIDLYKKLDCVKSAQILFITDPEALTKLKPVANRVMRTIQAMKKLSYQELPDCDNCDFQNVCDDIEEMQVIRNQKLASQSN